MGSIYHFCPPSSRDPAVIPALQRVTTPGRRWRQPVWHWAPAAARRQPRRVSMRMCARGSTMAPERMPFGYWLACAGIALLGMVLLAVGWIQP
jgi:hypothetical protein